MHCGLSVTAVALGHSLLTVAPHTGAAGHSEQLLLPKQITRCQPALGTLLWQCVGRRLVRISPCGPQDAHNLFVAFDSGFCRDVETDGNSIR